MICNQPIELISIFNIVELIAKMMKQLYGVSMNINDRYLI